MSTLQADTRKKAWRLQIERKPRPLMCRLKSQLILTFDTVRV